LTALSDNSSPNFEIANVAELVQIWTADSEVRRDSAMAREEVPIGRLAFAMAVFLIIGAPIVLYDWWTLDQVLAGIFHPLPMVVASGLACIFLIMAAILGRYIRNLIPPE
jgi:hypothetical protein